MLSIDFTGQVALVTGASRGIGFQIAKDLAEGGATLIAVSSGRGSKDFLKELPSSTTHITSDFSDRSSLNDFLEQLRTLPRCDVCINNAGTAHHNLVGAISEKDWDGTIEVDLRAPALISQAVAELMKKTKYGRIVGITSLWAHAAYPKRGAYSAAKFGLRGFCQVAAAELGQYGILVNTVAPGLIRTEMLEQNWTSEMKADFLKKVPLNRFGETQDISRAVLFLASRLNSYITGQHLVVDGGYVAQ